MDPRTTVVVITRDRRDELLHTLDRLADLPERPRVLVVDNASGDGTAEAVRLHHPGVELLPAPGNLGAVGRNHAVRHVTTRYVAFCDDDTWWEPGALARAADLLDGCPSAASVTGRILVEPGGREDPIVPELRHSPVPAPPGLPGPALLGILAGASLLRVSAFRAVGGFSPRLWLGGEEELLSLDLAAAGHHLLYADDVVVHHRPSPRRDRPRRLSLGIRNTLWTAWLRRPVPAALRRTGRLLGDVPARPATLRGLAEAVAGLPWVLRERRPVPAEVERGLVLLEAPQKRSRARRYVQ
ncbi:glycosyltransferase family 2 protein [Allostreptomyces psammosilenae]|uniref:GT2 family glycosyltransferase n=1 Tax=Allostreptomyces psammosilenae TaxID=1892865 RepID=A0A852ZS49_9ACTN|nr:glycosyltransferase [Allostreptomyces psammosilenae]NYI04100.1 GT2 family glycosyltransferase [Allostreptomyces psammosilenae]